MESVNIMRINHFSISNVSTDQFVTYLGPHFTSQFSCCLFINLTPQFQCLSSSFLVIAWPQGPHPSNAFTWLRLGKEHPASQVGTAMDSISTQLMISAVSITSIQNLHSQPIITFFFNMLKFSESNFSLKKLKELVCE